MKLRLALVLAAALGVAAYLLLQGDGDAATPGSLEQVSRAAVGVDAPPDASTSLVAPTSARRPASVVEDSPPPAPPAVVERPPLRRQEHATLRVTVHFAPNDVGYEGIPLRLTRWLPPGADEPPQAPVDAVTGEGGVVEIRVPAGADLDLEIPSPWYFEPHETVTWDHGPRQIPALDAAETRDVTVGLWSIPREAAFGATVLSMEDGEPLRRAFAFHLVDGETIPYEAARRMRYRRDGRRSNSKGSIRLEARWWPNWAVFVQADGHAPRIVAPGPPGLAPREPREIRLPVASSIRGRIDGIPLTSTAVHVLLEVTAQQLAPAESPDLRLPSAKVVWSARVSGAGAFELDELPPETRLRLIALDQTGETLGSHTCDALEPGEERRVDWTLD